jgi:tyrosyl-tRNA synthetase
MTGLELIKRIADGEAYGVTTPLITDSTGKKFGKSEGNALRLDPKKNSPFVIYQYFINTNDADIEKYFKLLTLAEFDTIKNIITKHNEAPEQRIGQEFLAHTIVQTVF